MKQLPSPTSCTVNSLTTTNSAKIVSHLLLLNPTHIPPHTILPVLHISLHCLAQWQESPHQCKYDVKNTGQQPTLLYLSCRLRSEHKYGRTSDGKRKGGPWETSNSLITPDIPLLPFLPTRMQCTSLHVISLVFILTLASSFLSVFS